jgi:hypothetical protein
LSDKQVTLGEGTLEDGQWNLPGAEKATVHVGFIGDNRSRCPSPARKMASLPRDIIETTGNHQTPITLRATDAKNLQEGLVKFRWFITKTSVPPRPPTIKEALGSAQLLKGSDPDDKDDSQQRHVHSKKTSGSFSGKQLKHQGIVA